MPDLPEAPDQSSTDSGRSGYADFPIIAISVLLAWPLAIATIVWLASLTNDRGASIAPAIAAMYFIVQIGGAVLFWKLFRFIGKLVRKLVS